MNKHIFILNQKNVSVMPFLAVIIWICIINNSNGDNSVNMNK